MNAITCDDLVFRRGDRTVLNRIGFELAPGRLLGLIASTTPCPSRSISATSRASRASRARASTSSSRSSGSVSCCASASASARRASASASALHRRFSPARAF